MLDLVSAFHGHPVIKMSFNYFNQQQYLGGNSSQGYYSHPQQNYTNQATGVYEASPFGHSVYQGYGYATQPQAHVASYGHAPQANYVTAQQHASSPQARKMAFQPPLLPAHSSVQPVLLPQSSSLHSASPQPLNIPLTPRSPFHPSTMPVISQSPSYPSSSPLISHSPSPRLNSSYSPQSPTLNATQFSRSASQNLKKGSRALKIEAPPTVESPDSIASSESSSDLTERTGKDSQPVKTLATELISMVTEEVQTEKAEKAMSKGTVSKYTNNSKTDLPASKTPETKPVSVISQEVQTTKPEKPSNSANSSEKDTSAVRPEIDTKGIQTESKVDEKSGLEGSLMSNKQSPSENKPDEPVAVQSSTIKALPLKEDVESKSKNPDLKASTPASKVKYKKTELNRPTGRVRKLSVSEKLERAASAIPTLGETLSQKKPEQEFKRLKTNDAERHSSAMSSQWGKLWSQSSSVQAPHVQPPGIQVKPLPGKF